MLELSFVRKAKDENPTVLLSPSCLQYRRSLPPPPRLTAWNPPTIGRPPPPPFLPKPVWERWVSEAPPAPFVPSSAGGPRLLEPVENILSQLWNFSSSQEKKNLCVKEQGGGRLDIVRICCNHGSKYTGDGCSLYPALRWLFFFSFPPRGTYFSALTWETKKIAPVKKSSSKVGAAVVPIFFFRTRRKTEALFVVTLKNGSFSSPSSFFLPTLSLFSDGACIKGERGRKNPCCGGGEKIAFADRSEEMG